MGGYAGKRLLLFVPTLLLISVIIFFFIRILPGDVAIAILTGETGEGGFTHEQLAQLRKELGTDRPLMVQYGEWLWGLVRGDLGDSLFFGSSVFGELKVRFPITLELAVMALLISFVLAIPIGVISAVKQDTWIDGASRLFVLMGITAPTFWVGILLVFFLSTVFNWLPPLGYQEIWENPFKNLQQLIFPALALGYFNTAFTARITRSSMLEVLREDYIRTARSKGLTELVVVSRHALKNAFLPVITVSGWQFSRLLGGSVIIESIFIVPGMGNLLLDAIVHRDFTMIQGIIIIVAVSVLTLNLLVDLAYGWLNPRVRYG